jgi:lipopolysaccharide/colanic/teichoic acid biosynthesis glycosyltransferase
MFEMLKFRTMLDGAERPGTALLTEVDDPRITPVGRVLRKTRLDELPQLWNVLKGEMSVVGPRPERPEFLENLQREIPFWTRRHLVRPGITGWAQVRGGYASDAGGMVTKLSHDFYYLKHRSLLLDLAILVKTMKIVLSGSGAR